MRSRAVVNATARGIAGNRSGTGTRRLASSPCANVGKPGSQFARQDRFYRHDAILFHGR